MANSQHESRVRCRFWRGQRLGRQDSGYHRSQSSQKCSLGGSDGSTPIDNHRSWDYTQSCLSRKVYGQMPIRQGEG